MKITKTHLTRLIKEEMGKITEMRYAENKETGRWEEAPVSYDELLVGIIRVTQALSDVVGHGGGPYDHLISDLDYAKDLIGRTKK
jgi:hypothetical protein